jgi:hypothetical protein
MYKDRIPLFAAAVTAALAPATAAALTASAVSAADTLDSRPPAVAVVYPAGGEIFTGGEIEILQWTIDEQSWAGAATPVTIRVLDGATLLDEQSVPPDPDGSYALSWSVTDVDADAARVVVLADDRFGWAGDDTSAVFTIAHSGTDAPPLPLADRLGPATPNPFNPGTRIDFALARAADISLSVYDARGREIARLAEGPWPAGAHAVTWRGRDAGGAPVASGAYLARLHVRGSDGTSRPAGHVVRLTLVR